MDKFQEKIKEVIAELKQEGLHLSEEALCAIWKILIDAIVEYAQESENKLDDIILLLKPQLDEIVLNAIDNIDGIDDQRI
jgi:hypothetical protein